MTFSRMVRMRPVRWFAELGSSDEFESARAAQAPCTGHRRGDPPQGMTLPVLMKPVPTRWVDQHLTPGISARGEKGPG